MECTTPTKTILSPGTNMPSNNTSATVMYTGTFTDGKVFDKSTDPFSFPFSNENTPKRVIDCWDKEVRNMKVGEEAELCCPPTSAYGSQKVGPIPPNTTLKFIVKRYK